MGTQILQPSGAAPANGLIRLPGLEIRAAEHCNLRCNGCSQNSPFRDSHFPDLELIAGSLGRLSKVLCFDRLTILGGEPLLSGDLVELLRIVRENAVFDRLFVTTNGLLLDKMSEEFWQLVDVIEVSVYPATEARILAKAESMLTKSNTHGVELHFLPTKEFRHITLSSPIVDMKLVRALYNACYFRKYTNTLHEGRFYKCAPCINARSRSWQDPNSSQTDDGVVVNDASDLQERLVSYLASKVPLGACQYCVGSSGASFPHSQLASVKLLDASEAFSEGIVSEHFWEEYRRN